MQWGKTIRWIVVGLALLIVVVFIGGYFFLKSSAFRQYAARKVEASVLQSTNARTEIASLDLSLSPLVVRLGNITVHGTEPNGEAPLFHVDS